MSDCIFKSNEIVNCYIFQIILVEAAQEALTDMPPRAEEELDPVTLHNLALMNMDANPTAVRTCRLTFYLFT